MAYYNRKSLQGVYSPLEFPLPSNSLPSAAMVPVAVAAIESAANASVKRGNTGMSGAWGPRPIRWPGAYSRSPYDSRAGMGDVFEDFSKTVTNNPLLIGGLAIGALLLLGSVGRARRRPR